MEYSWLYFGRIWRCFPFSNVLLQACINAIYLKRERIRNWLARESLILSLTILISLLTLNLSRKTLAFQWGLYFFLFSDLMCLMTIWYVDDIVLVLPQDGIENIVGHFNNYGEHIQFAIETERYVNYGWCVPFLDTKFIQSLMTPSDRLVPWTNEFRQVPEL